MIRSVVGGLRIPLRKLADTYPVLRGPIGRTWNTYERLRFTYYTQRNARKYRTQTAPINPYQLIELPPEFIDGHSPGRFDSIADAGRVVGSDWDRQGVTAFEDRFRYPSFQEHFIEGVPWAETEFYQTKRKKIKSDREAKYVSVEALDRKCEELDRMYQKIRDDGYKTQVEIRTSRGTAGSIVGDGGRGWFPGSDHLVRNEVSVDIARDGEPMLNEGRHRTCIAKLLELDHIPVRIVVRHREWQDLRNRIASFLSKHQFSSRSEAVKAINEEIIGDHVTIGVEHPDIQSVINAYYPSK